MTSTGIGYSLGSSRFDNTPSQRSAADFDEFEKQICSSLSTKKGELYFCAAMNEGSHQDTEKFPGTDTYRLAALAQPRRFICFDHDGYDSPETYEQLKSDLNDYRGFAYETWSSTAAEPRARIVLETDRELDRNESIAICEAFDSQLIALYGEGSIKTDSSVYRPEQPCYCPGIAAPITSFKGNPLKVDELLPPTPQRRDKSNAGHTQSVTAVDTSQRFLLSHQSVLDVLERISPFPEPDWSKVANILARAYGEKGRDYFIKFSEGQYWSEPYTQFAPHEANKRFDRALKEKNHTERPAGIRALLEMAKLNISDVKLERVCNDVINEGLQDKTLTLLSREFALIDLSGQIRVIRTADVRLLKENKLGRSVNFYQKKDAELIMKRFLEEKNLAQSGGQIQRFFTDPRTMVYEATAFHPLPQPPNVLNYWCEPIRAIAGPRTEGLKTFLLDVICAGESEMYEYVMNYLAHMLQKPEVKPGVAIILLGGQGVGKGTFFRLLTAIWKGSTLVVQDIDQVVGKFNSALERSYVVCMDEAMFRGDRKASEKLKALVTEPIIRIEEKYEPSRTIKSFHRFFAASNNDHFGQVDSDDRRYVFLRVPDHKRCDHEYFSQLHDDLNDEKVMSAFVHELRLRDLSRVNIFARPISEEHISQRIQSLHGFARFWHDLLVREEVGRDGSFISTNALIKEYNDYNSREVRFAPLQSNELSMQLAKMCPSATKDRTSLTQGFSQRGYDLPPLHVCRSEFEAYMGAEIDWDECPGEQPKYSHPF